MLSLLLPAAVCELPAGGDVRLGSDRQACSLVESSVTPRYSACLHGLGERFSSCLSQTLTWFYTNWVWPRCRGVTLGSSRLSMQGGSCSTPLSVLSETLKAENLRVGGGSKVQDTMGIAKLLEAATPSAEKTDQWANFTVTEEKRMRGSSDILCGTHLFSRHVLIGQL